MSYMMCARITFPETDKRGGFQTFLVSSVRIESSWKLLTDTAEIVLPRKMSHYEGKNLADILRAGDRVMIELGYDGNWVTEFEGYILSVSRGIPITVKCEDEMYRLKRKTVSYSRKSVTLGQLLKDVAQGYEVKTSFGDTELGAVRYAGKRVSEIFDDLQKLGFYTYFIGKTLYCGDVYSDKTELPEVRIELEREAVSQDLNETDGEYEVIATAMLGKGRKLEVKAGVPGAETFKIRYSDKDMRITPETLGDFARRFYERLKKQRYKGGVELFGTPSVTHGMILELSSVITPEMSGRYFIEKVTKEFSDNATYRQKLELGGRAE